MSKRRFICDKKKNFNSFDRKQFYNIVKDLKSFDLFVKWLLLIVKFIVILSSFNL